MKIEKKKKKNPRCKKTRKNTNSTCRNKESSKYSLPRMHAKYLRRKKNKNERYIATLCMSKAYEERSRWRTVNLEEPSAALKITQHLARYDVLCRSLLCDCRNIFLYCTYKIISYFCIKLNKTWNQLSLAFFFFKDFIL